MTEENIHHSSATSSWFTPSYILEPARNTLGGFDLDPLTEKACAKLVGAKTNYYDHGYNRPWAGTVWCNPPKPARPAWTRMVEAFETGEMPRGIFLAYSMEQLNMSQRWTHNHPMQSFSICYPFDRIEFMTTAEMAIARLVKISKKKNKKTGEMRGLTKGEKRRMAELREMKPNALVPGNAPPHSSAIIGVNVNHVKFQREYKYIGGCYRGEELRTTPASMKRKERMKLAYEQWGLK